LEDLNFYEHRMGFHQHPNITIAEWIKPFSALMGYRRIVDDVVIYDSNEEQHSSHVRRFLQKCLDK